MLGHEDGQTARFEKARVALARRIDVIMHTMLREGTCSKREGRNIYMPAVKLES
jgi:hypothetical protein